MLGANASIGCDGAHGLEISPRVNAYFFEPTRDGWANVLEPLDRLG